MRTARYVWFGISIVLGLLIGLVLGNRLIPMPYENQPMSNLRDDYKADVVLMAAEGYQFDQNIQRASETIQRLGVDQPLYQAQQALVKARALNYSQSDVELMVQLVQALQKISPTQRVTP